MNGIDNKYSKQSLGKGVDNFWSGWTGKTPGWVREALNNSLKNVEVFKVNFIPGRKSCINTSLEAKGRIYG